MAWHINEMFAGNRARLIDTFVRTHTLGTLERDLGMLKVPSLVVVDSIQKSPTLSHINVRR